jgi:hypothetical protein
MFQALARDRLDRLNASPSSTPWTYFERQKEDAIAGAEENFPIANSGDVMLNENLWVNSE